MREMRLDTGARGGYGRRAAQTRPLSRALRHIAGSALWPY